VHHLTKAPSHAVSTALRAGGCVLTSAILIALVAGCTKPAPAASAMQAMPVQVSHVELKPVPESDTYVATIKSRRSSTMQPQVEGNLTRILVHSGDVVKAGQVLMVVDPLKQMATVQQQLGSEAQVKATYDYNRADVERQRRLFEAGITSKQAYDQAVQAFENSKGSYSAATGATSTQREQLKYFQIRAPFDGVVGDVPVHVGDYVATTTVLTTVDENKDLEAYIYLPTERAAQVKQGLPVEILDTAGNTLVKSTVNFISPQVDNGLQSILAKAPVPHSAEMLRNAQLVKARVTWGTKPLPSVPVLAVTRLGGQAFVFVAASAKSGFVAHQVPVTLGDTVANTYPVLDGLKPGDKVILSGIQFLQEGAPVHPLN
jgi:RND family efflux transporter MFP subunit